MANITLNNQLLGLATYIPNDFIDKHMTAANGEYVKIYLYLLRCMGRQDRDLSIGKIADHFDHTEKDVQRALSYWEKMNLLKLAYDTDNNLTEISILTGQDASGTFTQNTTALTADLQPLPPADSYGCFGTTEGATRSTESPACTIRAISIPDKVSPTKDQLKMFCEREDVQELIFLTETYLGRTISRSDLDHIFSWYDQLHFSAELIEFLVENCIAKGHSSLRYMQKVAEDWYSQGIKTPDEAKQLVSRNNETYYVVLKAFGIRGRNLVPSEMDLLKKWSVTYGFNKEMISEACKRTIQNIHEPSFEYTDSILTNWHTAKLTSLEDVKKADEAFAKQQAESRSKSVVARLPQPTKFNNFQQRGDLDYDQLTQQLLEKSIP